MKFAIRALVLGALLLIGLSTAAWAAPFPWKTLDDMGTAVTDMSEGSCINSGDPVDVLRMFLVYEKSNYGYFTAEDGRVVVAYWKGDLDSTPDEIGIGTVDPDNRGDVPDLQWEPYDSIKHGHNPCTVLYPEKA